MPDDDFYERFKVGRDAANLPEALTDIQIAFNAGLQAACDWHEARAREAEKASGAAGYVSYAIALSLIGIMTQHRETSNALRELRYVTRAEQEDMDRTAEMMNR